LTHKPRSLLLTEHNMNYMRSGTQSMLRPI